MDHILIKIQILPIQIHILWWPIFMLSWQLYHFSQCKEEEEEEEEAEYKDYLLDHICLYNPMHN